LEKVINMKITILFLVLAAVLSPVQARAEGSGIIRSTGAGKVASRAAARAASGCTKGQDACYDQSKQKSDFLSAVETARKNTPRSATGQKAVPAKLVEAPVLASSATAPVQSSEAPAQGGFSRPAWLLLVLGGLAALYYYLKDGKHRGRSK
jgi:hypothetical protein